MPLHLPRSLKSALRSLVTKSARWPDWRVAHLPGGDASDLLRDAIVVAAYDCGVDICTVAAEHGQHVTPEELVQIVADLRATLTFPLTAAKDATDMDNATNTAAAPTATLEGRDVADVIREALSPAEGMVGQKLLDMLAASVTPLAVAATAGPRIVTQTVTRTVKVSDTGDATPRREVARIDAKSGRDVFGVTAHAAGDWLSALEQPVSMWDGTLADDVPPTDDYHVWDVEALACLSIASRFADDGSPLRNMSRVLMFGPAGTGKTTTATQFAARTGRPFVRIAFDRSMEAPDLIGTRILRNGTSVFHEGALVAAMQVPGCVVLLDEPSFLRPGVAAVLQTILDTGCVYLKEDGNRRVDLAPGVIICAADNTNLTGDETGRYADTMAQNVALQDRFAYLVALDYLPEGREAAVLANRTGIALDAAKAMVTFASTTRKSAATRQLTTGCSLRRLVAWAAGCVAGVPSTVAFKAAIYNAASAEDRETIRGLEKNTVNHAAIDALVRGLPVPSMGQTSTAQGAAAARVFQTA
jgi:MoxR-like ATPase